MAAGAQPNSFTDRAFFEALVQNGSDAIITIDTDDRIRFANDATKKVFGYDPEELIGESLTTIMPERFQDAHRAAIEQYLETGERTLDWSGIELPAEHRDGHEVQVSITFEEYEYGGQKVFSGIMRDVTERKERERKLEQQNEQLERFASVVSHDLRTPLNVASGRIELARETEDISHLGAAEDALDRMTTLIQDALTLARDGRTVESPSPVALVPLIETAWQGILAGDATLSLPEESVTVLADKPRLQRCVENVLRNAVDHADDPHIDASVTVIDDTATLSLCDDGPGIPADKREDVLQSGYTTSSEGSGLGLGIVARIAEAHGWGLSLSESDAGGLCVELSGIALAE